MATKKKLVETPKIPKPVDVNVVELEETLDPTIVTEERPEMPKPESQAVPNVESGLVGERPKPTVTTQAVDPNKAALEAAKANSSSYEQLAEQRGKASLENTPDIDNTRQAYLNELQKKGFAQWALDTKADAEKRLEEDKQRIAQEQKNARIAGYSELGAAIANLIGVGAHNAVSQTYKPFAQDWMKKADQDAREHRNRVDDLRARQRDTELKMAQISQQGIQAAIQNERQREQDKLNNELKQAQIAYQNARTESEKAEAQQKALEAEKKLGLLDAQTLAQLALAGQRDASGRAALIKANSSGKGKNDDAKKTDTIVTTAPTLQNSGSPYLWDPVNGKYGPKPAQTGWAAGGAVESREPKKDARKTSNTPDWDVY